MSLVTLMLPLLMAGAPVDHFEEGLRLFREAQAYEHEHATGKLAVVEKYRAAADAFEAAYDEGLVSTEVLTNLGNAYYFADDPGRAVLNYRRALLLDGSNQRARDALESIERQMPIRAAAVGQTESLFASLFFWHQSLSFDVRRAMFLVGWVAFWACLILARSRRKLFGGLAVFSLVVAGALGASLAWDIWADPAVDRAVILTEATGRRGDGEAYSESHSEPFPPGTEGIVQETRRHGSEAWVNLRLADGSDTWVEGAAVERVVH